MRAGGLALSGSIGGANTVGHPHWLDRAALGSDVRISATRSDATYELGGQHFFLTRKQSPHWQIEFYANAAARITVIGFGGPAVRYVEVWS